MGLFDQLGVGILGQGLGALMPGMAKQNTGQQMAPYLTAMGITDGDAAYDTMAEVLAIIGALAAGSVWTKVWERTISAQRTERWGFGSPNQPHNQGYMWFCSIDTNVDFQVGKLRLMQNNANESRPVLCKEFDDTRLHLATVTTLTTATPTDINQMQAVPEQVQVPQAGEDSKLQLWYRCITAATAEDNVGFSIPATTRQ